MSYQFRNVPCLAWQARGRLIAPALALGACVILSACARKPLLPYSDHTTPLALVPVAQAGVVDERARFREIFCTVLEKHGHDLPDYRPCGEALSRAGKEPAGTGRSVDLGASRRRLVALVVPGIGHECFAGWLQPPGTVATHVREYGYELMQIQVDGLSSTKNNARQIREALMAMPREEGAPRLVLIGYSKGAPDILEALVAYPEIRDRVAAMVSVAGSVGGSPLANDVEQYQADLLRHLPGLVCEPGDGGGVESLRPGLRKAWLAENTLPEGLRYYSMVTLPDPERISSVLKSSYRKLATVDGRNDSQVIFYDQIIPGSTLLAYLNADHWAIAVPVSRSRKRIAETFATQNAYPREALVEALLRFIEEDLAAGTN